MNANEIINYIKTSEKKTPVKLFFKCGKKLDFGEAKVFQFDNNYIVFADWTLAEPILKANANDISDLVIENECRNSAIPMADLKEFNARIEPGAIIREHVEIGNNAVIMMGAIINIGACIGNETMIDMGAVLGGRATVGNNCHIGANTVLAGVIEPTSAIPVVIEDNVLIGANATVIEGVHIGENSVVAAGAVVIDDIPANSVAAGIPARVVKQKDAKTESTTTLVDALRTL